MRFVIWSAGLVVLGVGLHQGRAQSTEQAQVVSVCEVKAHPENYLHKLIEITATASHGFEDSTVEDSQCPWPKGGPGIWMEYGGTRSTDTMYAGGGSPKPDREKPLIVEGVPIELVNDQNFKEFDKKLQPQLSKPKRGSDTVRATLRGRIFARHEGIAGTQVNPGWRGYGHMDCCMLFVVAQVVSLHPSR